MDIKTLQALLAEANKNSKEAKKRFEEDDGIEDMHDCNRWEATAKWLSFKIKGVKK